MTWGNIRRRVEKKLGYRCEIIESGVKKLEDVGKSYLRAEGCGMRLDRGQV